MPITEVLGNLNHLLRTHNSVFINYFNVYTYESMQIKSLSSLMHIYNKPRFD